MGVEVAAIIELIVSAQGRWGQAPLTGEFNGRTTVVYYRYIARYMKSGMFTCSRRKSFAYFFLVWIMKPCRIAL